MPHKRPIQSQATPPTRSAEIPFALLADGFTEPIVFRTAHIKVGRWKGNVELLLDDQGVHTKASRLHAEICRVGCASWYVHDVSKNGTYVNGNRVPDGGLKLHVGDRIGFGTVAEVEHAVEGSMPRFHYTVVRAPNAMDSVMESELVGRVLRQVTTSETLATCATVSRSWRKHCKGAWTERYGAASGDRRFLHTDTTLIATIARGFRACPGVQREPVRRLADGRVSAVSLGGGGGDNSVLLTLSELLSLVPSQPPVALESFRVACGHRLLDQTDRLWATAIERLCAPANALRALEICSASFGDESAATLVRAMRCGRLRHLSSLVLHHSSISPAAAARLIEALPHCPALSTYFGGGGVHLGSVSLYAWARQQYHSSRPELELVDGDGSSCRFLLNFCAPQDDWR